MCLRESERRLLTAMYVDIQVSGALLQTLTPVADPDKRWQAKCCVSERI